MFIVDREYPHIVNKKGVYNDVEYRVICSGSTGNSVIIDNVLIDVGLTKKILLSKELDIDITKIKYVLITHSHKDHLNLATLKALKHKTIICNKNVYDIVADKYDIGLFKEIIVVEDGDVIEFEDITFEVFNCIHDVPTQGYVLLFKDMKWLYQTDTSTLNNAPDYKYNALFIECNYCEVKFNAIINNKRTTFREATRLKENKRHSSKQHCFDFYAKRSVKNALFVKLHKSSKYY